MPRVCALRRAARAALRCGALIPRARTPPPFPPQAGAGDSMPEVEVLLKGLLAQSGVEGFLVFNDEGE